MNICLLGLSGSGKTCYLYTACHVLSRGVSIKDHVISATSKSRQQQLRLNKGIEQMANNVWPEGSVSTLTYPFDLKIDGKIIGQFTIYDYRGGALDGMSDDDQDDANELFDTFEDSSCIVFLIDGDTVLEGLNPNDVAPVHQNRVSPQKRLQARNKINYIEALLQECNERMNRNVPILLSITKSDIFTDSELLAGYKLLRELLPSVFSLYNDKIVGVSSVTLGENLQNNQGRLTGILRLNTSGNVHIPILFALLQEIDEDGSQFDNPDEARRLIRNLFTTDKISFYRGGKPALLV